MQMSANAQRVETPDQLAAERAVEKAIGRPVHPAIATDIAPVPSPALALQAKLVVRLNAQERGWPYSRYIAVPIVAACSWVFGYALYASL